MQKITGLNATTSLYQQFSFIDWTTTPTLACITCSFVDNIRYIIDV